MLSSVSISASALGSNLGAFQQMGFKPTIANWLREYQVIIQSREAIKTEPGAFHIVKFMDTNKYVRLLKPEERGLAGFVGFV